MELQFHKESLPCMKQILEQIRDQELTQELKLAEGMPDVGNVICAWGQILIRGKQWESDRVGVSGGVQVCVLYAPEDGSEPRTVEAWIPFQENWELPQTDRDGKLWVMPALRQVDARSVSSRKLMLRSVISLLGKAWVDCEADIYTPGEVPEDVQLLVRERPVLIPTEIGEKSFVMDEELTVPSDLPEPEKILCARLTPRISEGKVMAGKLVFRGGAELRMLYRAQEGMHTMQLELPFAQYGELGHEYDPQATVWVLPVLTSFEADLTEDGRVRMKAGITAQYMVCDRKELKLVEDGYSTGRQMALHMQEMELPVMWDRQWVLQAESPWNNQGTVVDTVFYPDHPRMGHNGQQLTGRFQMLYYDDDGMLRSNSAKWEHTLDQEGSVYICGAENVDEQGAQLQMLAQTMDSQGLQTLAGATLGEGLQKDPGRPSLILRRVGSDSLWELAKRTGSTVSAIQKANGLEKEPEAGAMLMIPVS